MSACTIERRAILPTSALKKKTGVKKLVLVSATSMLVTGASKEALKRVPYIHYPVQFKDTDQAPVQALIDSMSEVNAIHPSFVK